MGRRSIIDLTRYKKAINLLRDHNFGQIVNTLRFGSRVLRGFQTAHLSYSPVWLALYITARCNLRCQQCPFHGPDTPRESLQFRDMTLDGLREILDRFPRAIGITFTGGEPLLHRQLFELVHLAHERRMEVRIPTNGTLLRHHIDAFLEAPVDLLNVSFYGTDAESFAEVTGAKKTRFDDVTGAIAELAGRRPAGGYPRILRASFVCTKQTMYRAIDLVRLCEKLGVDQVLLLNLLDYGIPGYEEEMCLYEDDPEVQSFLEHLGRQQFRIPVFLPKLYKREYTPPVCNAPFGMLTVDGNGFIGPCCIQGTGQQWDNLFETSEVWNGSTLLRARRDLLDPACPLPPICMHCEEMIPERGCIGR